LEICKSFFFIETKIRNMNEQSIEITQNHVDLLQPVIQRAIQYEEMMNHKRKLGITGEVGEVKACFKYGLKVVLDSQSAGYDAIDTDGKRVQIKARRSETGRKLTNPTRLSSFSNHDFDYCLLLLLDKNYEIERSLESRFRCITTCNKTPQKEESTIGCLQKSCREDLWRIKMLLWVL